MATILTLEELLQENASLRNELIEAQNYHEIFFQKKLEKLTALKHEYIDELETDLSNDDIIIEIKRSANWRNAVSQLELYHHVKKQSLGHDIEKVLVLFGPPWVGKQKERNLKCCNETTICIVWLDATDLIDIRIK